MEKKKRGRPKGTGRKIILDTSRQLKRRGRPPKESSDQENKNISLELEHNKKDYVVGGQKTTCSKCNIEIKFFVQPPLKEEKLKSAICSKCATLK